MARGSFSADIAGAARPCSFEPRARASRRRSAGSGVFLRHIGRSPKRKPEYADAYQKTLSQLSEQDPDHAAVQEGLGSRELTAGDLDQAVAHLRRAIALDTERGMAYSLLSEALARQDHLDEAIAASEKAVSIEPYKALYQKSLISQLVAARQYDKAVAAMEHYNQLFPEDDFMRKMLKIAKQ